MSQGRQVGAFNVVLEQADALERFRRLARQAGPAGKLYALCGFIEMSAPDAGVLQAELASVTEVIWFIDIDVAYEKRVCDLAKLVSVSGFVKRYFRLPQTDVQR